MKPRSPGAILLLLAVSGLFVALGFAVERVALFEPFRTAVQRRQAKASEFGGRLLAQQLQSQNLLEPVLFADPPGPRRSPQAWTLDGPKVQGWPSTTLAPPAAIERGLRVASLWLPEERHEVLLDDPEARGRDHEEPALLSLFEGGQLRWAGGVGLRLHGGLSRTHSSSKSYRVYLREDDYHSPPLRPRDLGWEGPDIPLLKVILHNDVRTDAYGMNWQFTSPLAYDLAAELGCRVPRTSPLLVVVNGREQGLYFATERIDLDYLEARWGHRSFALLRTKRDAGAERFRAGDRLNYRILRRRVRSGWDRRSVEEWVNLDNLERWFLSVLFNGTTDPFQGALVLDESDPLGHWFWVNWDMDHSFMQAKDAAVPAWEADLFHHVVGRRHPDERNRVLRRLTRWDPEWASEMRARVDEMLDETLRPEVVEAHLERYEKIAALYELEDPSFLPPLRDYLRQRPEVLRRQADRWLGSP